MLVAKIDGKKVVIDSCAISCENKDMEKKLKSHVDFYMRFEPHSPTMEHRNNRIGEILERDFDAEVSGWHEHESIYLSKIIDPHAKVAY